MSPRKKRPQSPRKWGGSARFCAWPLCTELIGVSMLMDVKHWDQVPQRLRDGLAKAKRQGDERAIARATAVIVEYARQQSVAQQGAGAR